MRRVRRVKVWRFRLFGLIMTAISGIGMNSDLLHGSDCGIGLVLLGIAGLWMLFGDPQRINEALK